MRSHEPRAPVAPLLRKEMRELVTGNSLWVLMLLLSPLVGYSFIQAVTLYAEASRPALSILELARQLSPFDGILVPTLAGSIWRLPCCFRSLRSDWLRPRRRVVA